MYSIKLKAEVKSKPGETVLKPYTPETLKQDQKSIRAAYTEVIRLISN